MARKNNPLATKVWKPLPTEKATFDQTGGALDGLDTVEAEDPRIAQRTFDGAAITGIISAGF